jgi:hypothetical protein
MKHQVSRGEQEDAKGRRTRGQDGKAYQGTSYDSAEAATLANAVNGPDGFELEAITGWRVSR